MSFINSCESPKPKPSRPELTILSPTSENNKKVLHIIKEAVSDAQCSVGEGLCRKGYTG